jgi:hypothetical protein
VEDVIKNKGFVPLVISSRAIMRISFIFIGMAGFIEKE